MMLNVAVVPGFYYAADSATTIEALRRPGAAEPAKAGDAVVAPKQEGAQGFYKVWVSDAPIEAEQMRLFRFGTMLGLPDIPKLAKDFFLFSRIPP